MFLEDLGQRLRERREAQRLTQLDVAQVLQVSPQAVSKWERGENAPDFDGTVFVSSVQGFTTRSELLRPTEIAIWTNGFLAQVTEATLRQGGIPVKYAGIRCSHFSRTMITRGVLPMRPCPRATP
jgi:class 3 adenylate cyclase